MSRLCQLEVGSSNEKSLLPLGLIANKFGQRIHGSSQAGGGRGTGVEPSPSNPAYSSEVGEGNPTVKPTLPCLPLGEGNVQ